MTRFRRDDDAGVYAILYAVLVVILVGMAAIVVDVSSVRADRRLDRSATDSAALGGVRLLDTSGSGAQPKAACLSAWDYLATTLRVAVPSGACSAFDVVTDAAAYCNVSSPPLIADNRTIGDRTFRIAWPLPTGADQGFLSPEIAPGSASQPTNTATQPGPTNTDGYSNGCDKLGVAIFQKQSFGLGGALGATGTLTQVHSVARVIPGQGAPGDVAALNVLSPQDCPTLRTTGSGKVLVGPTLKSNGTVSGPGIIAVESNGRGSCNGQQTSIDAGQSGTYICALAQPATTCQAPYGVIKSHALDPGGDATHAYAGNLFPSTPVPEGGTKGYVPVTSYYGCATLSSCNPPATNYISQLVSAYGSGNPPTSVYGGSQAPYTAPACSTTPCFTTRPELCPTGNGGTISGVVTISAGYNYADCDIKIGGSGIVIVKGGTLVVKGGIDVNSGGCFLMNVPVTLPLATCPTAGDPLYSGAQVTTIPRPTTDAILFVRGTGCQTSQACINIQGSIVWPQTFVYSGGAGPLVYAGTTFSLWTAPGAGAKDPATTRTSLQQACYLAGTGVVDKCMDSRFGRLNYWSESSNTSQPNGFTGQANLGIVGIFFTPRSAFNLAGGQNLSAVAAQFWAYTINVTGSGTLPLSPFDEFSRPPLLPDLVLIR